jgi:glucose 1-dehydrogenase
MKLKGRKALVTGADSGIGQAIAITFAREGADVVVHYGTDQEGAQSTAQQAQKHGVQAHVLQADLADPKQAQQLFEQALSALGQIDILVNNAGTGGDVEQSIDQPLDDFVRVINIDMISPWALCQAAAKHMLARGDQGEILRGAMINITSVHEDVPSEGGAAYDAAKGGLRNITRTLALELAPKGIRVNNIAPGMIATPMTAEALEDPEQAKQAVQGIPMGRPGQPQEIANVALFLASDDASYVTGSSYFVDGGWMQAVGYKA